MEPAHFAHKWSTSRLKESAGAQQHFLDLCELLGERKPADVDREGTKYCFEKGTTKTDGRRGYADVFLEGHFGWEYKSKGKDLDAAYAQLRRYAPALGNPPLLIVSDMNLIRIHTHFQNRVTTTHVFTSKSLSGGSERTRLKAIFGDAEQFRPTQRRDELTEAMAEDFARFAQSLRERGHDAERVAHFVQRLVFCMFAEDIGILPDKLFERSMQASISDPKHATQVLKTLFAAMAKDGGTFGTNKVPWFNGGLFENDDVLPLQHADVELLAKSAGKDWSDIDVTIMGTLFTRGLDPNNRVKLGAHYTNFEKIMDVVEPVVLKPLRREWSDVRKDVAKHLKSAAKTKDKNSRTAANNRALRSYKRFLNRLDGYRVLDPACGSGNFLYVTLKALRDLEHEVILDCEANGFDRLFPSVGPENCLGIEVNSYAAELASVSLWIGELQWLDANGLSTFSRPILKSLDNIECKDAVLANDGTPASWPAADAIIGNPPFLGGKIIKTELGADYAKRLRKAYVGRLDGNMDLVGFWMERAREQIVNRQTERAGFVSTDSVTQNTGLQVMRRITKDLEIFDATTSETWAVKGANLEVVVTCYARKGVEDAARLDGEVVDGPINPDLTTGLNIKTAEKLKENRDAAFVGIQLSGPLDVSQKQAVEWIRAGGNPHGRGNAEVLRPYRNGDDITCKNVRNKWIIDFADDLTEKDAALFEAPFEHLLQVPYSSSETSITLKEARQSARDKHAQSGWFRPYWGRKKMRSRIEESERYLVTPETSEDHLFRWLRPPILPDKNLIVIATDHDAVFGVLQSVFHEEWALAQGSSLTTRPRYTHTSTFATFPFPDGLQPECWDELDGNSFPEISEAARELDRLRENWLRPDEWLGQPQELISGYEYRPPISHDADEQLKRRTVRALYKSKPAWLETAHARLDDAVRSAYGFEATEKSAVLKHLLSLNLRRPAEA